MSLVTAFWWEETGENRKKLRAERDQMVIVLSQKKFQNVINSNLTSKDPLKLKNNTNRKIRIYFHHVKVLTFLFHPESI